MRQALQLIIRPSTYHEEVGTQFETGTKVLYLPFAFKGEFIHVILCYVFQKVKFLCGFYFAHSTIQTLQSSGNYTILIYVYTFYIYSSIMYKTKDIYLI